VQAKYGISAADMSATRHLSRPPEAHSPLQELAFNVQVTHTDCDTHSQESTKGCANAAGRGPVPDWA